MRLTIRQDKKLNKLYPTGPDRFNNDGSPKYAEKASAELKKLWNKLTRADKTKNIIANYNRSYPKDETGNSILPDPGHWDDSIPSVGPLRSWADYHVACKIAHQWKQKERPIPYAAMPYFGSDIVDFVERQETDTPLFEAGRRKILLQLRIRNLDILSRGHEQRASGRVE